MGSAVLFQRRMPRLPGSSMSNTVIRVSAEPPSGSRAVAAAPSRRSPADPRTVKGVPALATAHRGRLRLPARSRVVHREPHRGAPLGVRLPSPRRPRPRARRPRRAPAAAARQDRGPPLRAASAALRACCAIRAAPPPLRRGAREHVGLVGLPLARSALRLERTARRLRRPAHVLPLRPTARLGLGLLRATGMSPANVSASRCAASFSAVADGATGSSNKAARALAHGALVD